MATAALLLVITGCTRPDDTASGDDTIAPADTTADTTADTSTATTGSTTPPETTVATVPDSTAPATTAAVSTVPGSTAAPTTPTTAPGSTATTAPPRDPDDLTLTFDSVGPHRFGDRDVDVVPALAGILGPPVRDDATEYPVADDGRFLDEFEEESYIAPHGRTVCFSNALCVQFGAGAPETLIMSGWRLDDSASSDLASTDGITIGSTWADHVDALAVEPLNSCFQVAYAGAGGIDVTLVSADEPFAAPNDDGDFVAGDPDPAAVTVIEMSAGELPFFVFADC